MTEETKKDKAEIIRPKLFNNFAKNNVSFGSQGKLFKHEYDEPTYISVRVNFFPDTYLSTTLDKDGQDNYSNSYNDMPQPLLTKNPKYYSTIKYLRDNLGDVERANLLERFIDGIIDLNNECPYYIKSVNGLNELLKVDPKRGSRVIKDGTITLKCIEGLDMRISALLNMYKKIAWDDVYQRWILPDMMRFFKMSILVSEFRLFSKYSRSDINLKIPTIKYECQMCEFDISDTIAHFNQLNIDKINEPLSDIEIKIKVGNVIEHDKYDLFTNSIDINDLILSRFISTSNNDSISKTLFYDRFGTMYDEISNSKKTWTRPGDKKYDPADNLKIISSGYLDKLVSGTLSNYVSRAANYITDEVGSFVHTTELIGGLTTADIISSFSADTIEGIIGNLANRSEDINDLYPEVNSIATNTTLDVALFNNALSDIVSGGATTKDGKEIINCIQTAMSNNHNDLNSYADDLKTIINDYKNTLNDTHQSIATSKQINQIL